VERHTANAIWIRTAIKLIGILFCAIGGLYLYCDNQYAKAADVKDFRTEIRDELRSINEKLDNLNRRPIVDGAKNGRLGG
jgi:hypothetical protein